MIGRAYVSRATRPANGRAASARARAAGDQAHKA